MDFYRQLVFVVIAELLRKGRGSGQEEENGVVDEGEEREIRKIKGKRDIGYREAPELGL